MNQAGASKSMEKLSSGFRINRAGDDAAGLAISEKMRGQIRGLKQASRNAQDGISLIQTAEGALNETHSILQRMRELAVQASTDTNTDADRAEIQEEINQLYAEIDRIANTTQFNTMNLLDGSYSGKFFHIGANEGQHVDLDIAAMGAADLGVHQHQADAVEATGTIQGIEITAEDGTNYEVEFVAADTANQNTTAAIVDGKIVVTLGTEDETDFAVDATLADVKNAIEGLQIDGESVGITASITDDVEATDIAAVDTGALTGGSPALEEDETVAINVSSQVTANQAIDIIDKAVVQVSGERSKLGAMQNRLEHTIANLGTSAENLQAAEARIRDLDMAEEIMAFTKNNILQQAATAMLAQANMAPQSVLQLLG
jgi:flagellin